MIKNKFLFGDKCGHCRHWMLFDVCPKEYRVGGGYRGPDMYANACGKFDINPRVVEKREAEHLRLLNLSKEENREKIELLKWVTEVIG